MEGILQIIRTMGKLSIYAIVLTTVLFNTLLADKTLSQSVKSVKEAKISIDIQNESLKKALEVIERNSDYHFVYTNKELVNDREVLVTVIAENESIEQLLLDISKQANVGFKQVNNMISVRNVGSTGYAEKIEVVIDQMVSGFVTDENGQPLPGASVIVKGTSNGVTTDIDGRFNLECPEDAVLTISFVGYQTQEISVNSRSSIDVKLSLDSEQLDEVVVVGYGTQKSKDLTGSVSTIQSDDIKKLPMVNLQQAMQGRVAGVQVQQNSGELDGNFKILVRGVGTFSGTNDPLYVVDGVPLVNGDLSSLNQNSIESISVLKDASATAIYGARASNGVVIITTKSGRYGRKPEVTLNIQTGIDQPTKSIDVMNASQYAEFYIAARTNANSSYNPPPELTDQAWLAAPEHNHNWQDLITRNGVTQDYTINVSGGSESTNYSVTGGYLSKKGVLVNTDLERATIGLNLNTQINDRLKAGLVLNGSRIDNNYNINDFTYNSMYYRLSQRRNHVLELGSSYDIG